MATKKKAEKYVVRPTAPWTRAFPDERNRFIEEARELLASYLYCKHKDETDYRVMDKATRKFLRETKP